MGAAAQRIQIVDGVRARAAPAGWWGVAQRVAASAGTLALSPFLIGVGVAVAGLSRRSPLVAHRRIGMDDRPFWMLKFRTMWGANASLEERPGCCGLVSFLEGAEHATAVPKNGHDPRVKGWLAAFLRRHSIDELPQLWHVIAGRMSLVGPRPLLESELVEYYGRDAAEVLTVLPGMTGLWQVSGRARLTYRQRKRLDLFLVRHNTILLQIRILARTFPQVWKGANSW